MEGITKLSRLYGADWIKPELNDQQKTEGNQLVYFRHEFILKNIFHTDLCISANNRYKLWVNGREVENGPCKGDRWRQFYDIVDISDFLKIGDNVIAVEVLYFSPAVYKEGNKTGPINIVSNVFGPLLVVKGDWSDSNSGERVSVSTGNAEWFYYMDNAIGWTIFKEEGVYMPLGAFEEVHSEKIPRNWKENLFSNIGWKTAEKAFEADGSGWGEFPLLLPKKRPIDFLYRREKNFEQELHSSDGNIFSFEKNGGVLSIPAFSKGFIELDAGELTTGYLNMELEGGKNSRIRTIYAESYSYKTPGRFKVKGIRSDSQGKEISGYEDIYYPSGEKETYETFWWRTFRFIKLVVETSGDILKITKYNYIETGYPLEAKSWVESKKSAWIKPFWDISKRTLQRCMHETYEDCPYYEQLQYAFDTRLEILFTHILSGETRLGIKAIEDFHCSMTPEGILQSRAPSDEPNIIPVFSLYWIFMLEDYYWQTGDLELPKRYSTTMESILNWFDRHIGSYGLTEKYYYWEFVDWADEWKNEEGYLSGIPKASLKGPVTTSNLIYVGALKCAAGLMSRIDRESTAVDFIKRADAIHENIQKHCWNAANGMYCEGPGVDEYTEHAQVWAVLTGLKAGEEARDILINALQGKDIVRCTFVFSFFLFRALEKADLYNLTEKLWGKWMFAHELGLTTWPEDISQQRSDCHAWGSLPVYEFIRCFLGVKPGEPGWKSILIEPNCRYIEDIRGNAVTPWGEVHVEYLYEGEKMHIKGFSPAGIPLKIKLPGAEMFLYDQGGNFELYL